MKDVNGRADTLQVTFTTRPLLAFNKTKQPKVGTVGQLFTWRLPVAGAFHSPSMAPAVAPFRVALDEVDVNEPRFTVFSCASAQPFSDPRAELAVELGDFLADAAVLEGQHSLVVAHVGGRLVRLDRGPAVGTRKRAGLGERGERDIPLSAAVPASTSPGRGNAKAYVSPARMPS